MTFPKIKIVFFGTPEYVIPIARVLDDNFDLVAIVTTPDQKIGRKQILTPTPVKTFAQAKTIPVFEYTSPQSLGKMLANFQPDLFVVASFGKIITPEILKIPKFGSLNIHPSVLPKYRGASPIQQAILNGDQSLGLSIMQMDEKMDHGPMIFTSEFRLSDTDNFSNLSKKAFLMAADTLSSLIPQFIAGKIKLVEQDHQQATFTKLLKKEDGFFDINNPPSSEILDRMIRAYFPWPTAWTRWQGKIVKFYPEQRIQMEGKKIVSWAEFTRGFPNFPVILG